MQIWDCTTFLLRKFRERALFSLVVKGGKVSVVRDKNVPSRLTPQPRQLQFLLQPEVALFVELARILSSLDPSW